MINGLVHIPIETKIFGQREIRSYKQVLLDKDTKSKLIIRTKDNIKRRIKKEIKDEIKKN